MGKYLRRSCVTEEHRFAEYFTDIVGPPLHLAEPLLESALNLHFKSRKWHFYTKTAADWVKADSKVISNLKKIKAKFPFHCYGLYFLSNNIFIEKVYFKPYPN